MRETALLQDGENNKGDNECLLEWLLDKPSEQPCDFHLSRFEFSTLNPFITMSWWLGTHTHKQQTGNTW